MMTDKERMEKTEEMLSKYCDSIDGECYDCIFKWKPKGSNYDLCAIISYKSVGGNYNG